MKAVIYDLDGTLLNTLEDIAAACNHVLENASYAAHPVEAYRKMVGNGFETLMKRAVGETTSLEKLQKLTDDARRFYAANMDINTKPYPGIPQILSELQDMCIRQAVFSNKPDPLSRYLIKHYFPDISFAEIKGAVGDKPLKPNPQVLLEMLAKAGLDRENAFYVGDSNVDIQTAKNAGLKSIGVAWGFRGENELREAGADHIIHTPAEIIGILQQ